MEIGIKIVFFHIFEKISVFAKHVNGPWSTVRNFLAQACDRGHIENGPRSRRPLILSHHKRKTIVQAATRNWGMTQLELQNQHASNVLICTINLILHSVSIKKWLAQTRFCPTVAHAKKR